MEINENTSPVPAHMFAGIDGRCMWCDVRPGSRHSFGPCDGH